MPFYCENSSSPMLICTDGGNSRNVLVFKLMDGVIRESGTISNVNMGFTSRKINNNLFTVDQYGVISRFELGESQVRESSITPSQNVNTILPPQRRSSSYLPLPLNSGQQLTTIQRPQTGLYSNMNSLNPSTAAFLNQPHSYPQSKIMNTTQGSQNIQATTYNQHTTNGHNQGTVRRLSTATLTDRSQEIYPRQSYQPILSNVTSRVQNQSTTIHSPMKVLSTNNLPVNIKLMESNSTINSKSNIQPTMRMINGQMVKVFNTRPMENSQSIESAYPLKSTNFNNKISANINNNVTNIINRANQQNIPPSNYQNKAPQPQYQYQFSNQVTNLAPIPAPKNRRNLSPSSSPEILRNNREYSPVQVVERNVQNGIVQPFNHNYSSKQFQKKRGDQFSSRQAGVSKRSYLIGRNKSGVEEVYNYAKNSLDQTNQNENEYFSVYGRGENFDVQKTYDIQDSPSYGDNHKDFLRENSRQNVQNSNKK